MKELIKKATNNACLTAIACALAATLTAEPALADGTAIKGDLSTDTKFLHTTVSATSYALIVFNSYATEWGGGPAFCTNCGAGPVPFDSIPNANSASDDPRLRDLPRFPFDELEKPDPYKYIVSLSPLY